MSLIWYTVAAFHAREIPETDELTCLRKGSTGHTEVTPRARKALRVLGKFALTKFHSPLKSRDVNINDDQLRALAFYLKIEIGHTVKT